LGNGLHNQTDWNMSKKEYNCGLAKRVYEVNGKMYSSPDIA
jgi:hypothetical protein